MAVQDIIKLIIIAIIINKIHAGHEVRNNSNSDVIVTYGGHEEATRNRPEPKPAVRITTKKEVVTEKTTTISVPEIVTEPEQPERKTVYEEDDGIVFIPNEKAVVRNEDNVNRGGYVYDQINKESVDNLMKVKPEEIVSESPKEDILFISGKNSENLDKPVLKKGKDSYMDTRRSETRIVNVRRRDMDCKNLECNNTVDSVCGGKKEHSQWRYRLFLNDCYFRKVNCAFSYQENRYREVSINKCKNIGAHISYRPYVDKTPQKIDERKGESDYRRMYSSRRSQNQGVDGKFCSHSCPMSCPDHYDPECALNNDGQRKIFVNHCKLDQNSCIYEIVWHRRPLSECVGGKKADMHQNRRFIGWMQRTGVIDKKGRLSLNKN